MNQIDEQIGDLKTQLEEIGIAPVPSFRKERDVDEKCSLDQDGEE